MGEPETDYFSWQHLPQLVQPTDEGFIAPSRWRLYRAVSPEADVAVMVQLTFDDLSTAHRESLVAWEASAPTDVSPKRARLSLVVSSSTWVRYELQSAGGVFKFALQVDEHRAILNSLFKLDGRLLLTDSLELRDVPAVTTREVLNGAGRAVAFHSVNLPGLRDTLSQVAGYELPVESGSGDQGEGPLFPLGWTRGAPVAATVVSVGDNPTYWNLLPLAARAMRDAQGPLLSDVWAAQMDLPGRGKVGIIGIRVPGVIGGRLPSPRHAENAVDILFAVDHHAACLEDIVATGLLAPVDGDPHTFRTGPGLMTFQVDSRALDAAIRELT